MSSKWGTHEDAVPPTPAAITFTDPPDNVRYGSLHGSARYRASRPSASDNLGKAFEAFLTKACRNLLSVTSGAVYMCMSSSELQTLHKVFTEAAAEPPVKAMRCDLVRVTGDQRQIGRTCALMRGWRRFVLRSGDDNKCLLYIRMAPNRRREGCDDFSVAPYSVRETR